MVRTFTTVVGGSPESGRIISGPTSVNERRKHWHTMDNALTYLFFLDPQLDF